MSGGSFSLKSIPMTDLFHSNLFHARNLLRVSAKFFFHILFFWRSLYWSLQYGLTSYKSAMLQFSWLQQRFEIMQIYKLKKHNWPIEQAISVVILIDLKASTWQRNVLTKENIHAVLNKALKCGFIFILKLLTFVLWLRGIF